MVMVLVKPKKMMSKNMPSRGRIQKKWGLQSLVGFPEVF